MQGIKPPILISYSGNADAGPRRAFKVTCAIRFSKSKKSHRLFPLGKKRTRNLLSAGREVNYSSLREVLSCGRGNIGDVLNGVNPCGAFSPSEHWIGDVNPCKSNGYHSRDQCASPQSRTPAGNPQRGVLHAFDLESLSCSASPRGFRVVDCRSKRQRDHVAAPRSHHSAIRDSDFRAHVGVFLPHVNRFRRRAIRIQHRVNARIQARCDAIRGHRDLDSRRERA